MNELLTPQEMGMADRLTIQSGALDGFALMLSAGKAVAEVSRGMFLSDSRIAVLCGPGNNGGDGYVAAQFLLEAGAEVICFSSGTPRAGTDAMKASVYYKGEVKGLSEFSIDSFGGVIDALYGAGLARALEGKDAEIVQKIKASGIPVVAVDLPSGISGESGRVLGTALNAKATVTFFRKKPGHILQPGRAHCGVVHVADIGIPDSVLDTVGPQAFENSPELWCDAIPALSVTAHKYSRGHVAVFSGGASATGASRLAAVSAARMGAGAVTLLSPSDAMDINAAHLTSIMLRETGDAQSALQFIADRKVAATVLGPGYGNKDSARELTISILGAISGKAQLINSLVLDADGITAFENEPEGLFQAKEGSNVALVLTPHEGEFARLFPDLATRSDLSKLDKAREAARRAQAVVIYKGPDTVVAEATGRAVINSNGTPNLATAGSGDVLAGMVAGLSAQGMPAFEAACAAVWMHADAARRFGRGLIAEDLIAQIPTVWKHLERNF